MLLEIKTLKSCLPSAIRLLEIKPKIDALYDSKKALREQINEFRDDIEGKEKEIESVRKEMEEAKE